MRRLLDTCGLLVLAMLASTCKAPPVVSQSASTIVAHATPTPEQPEQESKLISDFFVDADRLSYRGYLVVKLTKKVQHEYAPEMNSPRRTIDVSYAELRKNGRVLAKFDGVYFGPGNDTQFGLFALLGGETKQLVVSQTIPRNGRHWVVSLSPAVRLIYDSGEYGLSREEMTVLDIDKDGVYELSQELKTFVFFEDITFGATHLVDIVLKYDKRAQKYLPASHIFPDYTLAAIKISPVSLDRTNDKTLASDVLRFMLPYIYAGRRDEAWEYFDREYTFPNKEKLRAKIMAALRGDATYNYIYRRAQP